ncbi:MAG: hypothetical protein HY397_02460 [Candidatus Doudnabacteria bacterium]|nr:hypothetical protein [Candidatus Doudnabacteria bacterium]
MLKILAYSLLLSLVFSWEECKSAVKILTRGFFRRKPVEFYTSHVDRFVGTLILLAALPIMLTQLLASGDNFFRQLAVTALQLLIISILAVGLSKFIYWIKISSQYEGKEKLVPLTFSILGFFSPIFSPFAGVDGEQRKILGQLAFWLSLPALAGLALKFFSDFQPRPENYLPNIDAGIAALVGSLIIRVTVDFLENFFRLYRLEKLFSYYRVALGIALMAFIINGLAN